MGKQHVGIIGAGSMGGNMALLFNEKEASISLLDPNQDNLQHVQKAATESDQVHEAQISTFSSMETFMHSFPQGSPRIIVFSLPHGHTADQIIDQLEPYSTKGDVLIDCGNEWWQDTERRQARTSSQSFGNGPVHFVGPSTRGYQSARHGPSMSPGGTKEAYEIIKPLLSKWAAKDAKGNACVAYMGKRGAGHHVKCLHNGIEQGILSAVCEVYTLMRSSMKLSNDEIGNIFAEWDKHGTLRHNFLIKLASEIPHFKEGDGILDSKGIVDDIEDKVVQDADDTEGTGVWTMREFASRHVAAPTLAAAHCLRLISSTKGERLRISKQMKIASLSLISNAISKEELLESLRLALYSATLASFIQGLNIIARASTDEGWEINLSHCISIWRAGCIIQSDSISDMIQPIYEKDPHLINLLLDAKISQELASTYQPLKQVVKLGLEADAVIPALSATLEYLKAVASESLPTSFEEAELDAFGWHSYDIKGEGTLEPKKGAHHTEFRRREISLQSHSNELTYNLHSGLTVRQTRAPV